MPLAQWFVAFEHVAFVVDGGVLEMAGRGGLASLQAGSAGGNAALKEAAAEVGAPAAGPGAESATDNAAHTGVVVDDEARAAEPGATSAVGHEEPTLGEELEAVLCTGTTGGLARYVPVLGRTSALEGDPGSRFPAAEGPVRHAGWEPSRLETSP